MFRALVYTILGIFVLAVIRMIASTVSRGVAELFRESGTESAAAGHPPSGGGGALKRDPVCGTYVPADNSVRKVVAGEVLHFCSPECRDKYPA
jgi:YHS domain-containing protein